MLSKCRFIFHLWRNMLVPDYHSFLSGNFFTKAMYHTKFEVAFEPTTLFTFLQALDDVYLPERPVLARVLFIANIFITAIFILEMCMRIIAYSCRDYFYSAWNIIDFTIVVVSRRDVNK